MLCAVIETVVIFNSGGRGVDRQQVSPRPTLVEFAI